MKKNPPMKWVPECKEQFPKPFLIAAGFCYKGKLKLKKSIKYAKVKKLYYQ